MRKAELHKPDDIYNKDKKKGISNIQPQVTVLTESSELIPSTLLAIPQKEPEYITASMTETNSMLHSSNPCTHNPIAAVRSSSFDSLSTHGIQLNVPMTWQLWLGYANSNSPWEVRVQARRIRRFWFLNFMVALPVGMIQAWASVLDLNLDPFGVSTMEAAYLGTFMTISGCIGSVLVGMYLDRFVGRVKSVSCICLFLSALTMLLFTMQLLELKRQPFADDDTVDNTGATKGQLSYLFAMCILSGFFVNTSIPLCFELIMETVYGIIDEAMACAIQCMTNAIVQIVVLAMPTQFNGSTIWLDWVTFGSYVVGLLLLLVFKVEYGRTALDANADQSKTKVAKGCDAVGWI